MKKYIQPKINMIRLDPEQAIIQTCKAGGQYFNGGSRQCVYQAPVTTMAYCVVSVKGVRLQVGVGTSIDTENMPS